MEEPIINRSSLDFFTSSKGLLEEVVRSFFKEKVFQASTGRTVKSEEATLKSIGVSALYPDCPLAKEYQTLTDEILNRLKS